jgi:predicted nucleic acid-binding protein
MKICFLDTVGLIALWDVADQWHAAAAAAEGALKAPGVRLVTTPQVLFECGNASARRPYRSDVWLLWKKLRRRGDLIRPTDDEIEQAWTAYHQGRSGGPSIVDQVSFIIMRRLGITDAFTNDRHFAAAGFNMLF